MSNENETSKSVVKKEKTHIYRNPSITETEKFILRTVRGQDEQVRQVVNAVYKSAFLNKKSNVLIIGKSGTGKTEILRQLSKKLGKVSITIDANDYTSEGFVGQNVSDIIYDLIEAANFDLKKAENGVVIIDEIDKKAQNKESVTNKADLGKGVQNALLKLIEDKEIPLATMSENGEMQIYKLKTDKIMFFFAGAFSGIEEIEKKRMRKTTQMGFSANSKTDAQIREEKKVKKKDLIEYGMTEEFIGRIDTIVELNELSVEVLVDILEHSRKSELKLYTSGLKARGVSTKYSKKTVVAIAQKAKQESNETGARELANVINYVFDKAIYQIMASPEGTYQELVLQEGIEEDNTKYILK